MRSNLLSQGWEGEGAVSLISFPQPSSWWKAHCTDYTLATSLLFPLPWTGLGLHFPWIMAKNSTWSFLLMPHPLLDDYFYSWAYRLSLILQPWPLSWTPDLSIQPPVSLRIPRVCRKVQCSNFPAGLTWLTRSYLGILRCFPDHQNLVSQARNWGTEAECGDFSSPWGQDISLAFPETQIQQCPNANGIWRCLESSHETEIQSKCQYINWYWKKKNPKKPVHVNLTRIFYTESQITLRR